MLINCVDYISNLQCTEWKLYCKSVWHQLDSHKVPGKMEECIINQWLWLVNKLIHIHNEVHLSLTVYQNNNSAMFPKIVITAKLNGSIFNSATLLLSFLRQWWPSSTSMTSKKHLHNSCRVFPQLLELACQLQSPIWKDMVGANLVGAIYIVIIM